MSDAPIAARIVAAADALGLVSTFQWTGDTIRFAFADGAGDYPDDYSQANEPQAGFTAFSDDVRAIFRAAFAVVNDLIAVDLIEVADAGSADIAAAGSTAPALAYSYLPEGTEALDGDIWFNIESSFFERLRDPAQGVVGSYEWVTVLHEIGHALGLKHGHAASFENPAVLPARVDGLEYSVMTYRSYVGDPFTGAYEVRALNYAQGPMVLDIAALQALYGANYATRAGDTVYAVDPASGAFLIDGEVVAAPEAPVVLRTIWDGGGTDTLDLSAHATPVALDLRPGQGADLDAGGSALRAELGSGVFAPFHLYLSLLADDDPRALIENAVTGRGDDTLVGNAAANRLDGGAGLDRLWGGAGPDVFAGTAAQMAGDVILDFETEDSIEARDTASLPAWRGGADGAALLDFGPGGTLSVEGPAAAGVVVFTRDALDGLTTLRATGGGILLRAGDDRFVADASQTVAVDGGAGDDVIAGGAGDDLIIGGAGDDLLLGGAGQDTLDGGPGADRLIGGAGTDLFVVGLVAGETDTIADFDPAVDLLSMPGGMIHAEVDPAGAILTFETGAAVIFVGLTLEDVAGLMADVALTQTALGHIDAETALTPGADRFLAAQAPGQVVRGGAGEDVIVTGDGADALHGGWGSDLLRGGGGDDTLAGDAGSDWLEGGAGADLFVIAPEPSVFLTSDVIEDFAPGEDSVRLDGFGALDPDAFVFLDVPDGAALQLDAAQFLVFAGFAADDAALLSAHITLA